MDRGLHRDAPHASRKAVQGQAGASPEEGDLARRALERVTSLGQRPPNREGTRSIRRIHGFYGERSRRPRASDRANDRCMLVRARREIDTMIDVRAAIARVHCLHRQSASAAALDGSRTSETYSLDANDRSGSHRRESTSAGLRAGWVPARGNRSVTKTPDAGPPPDAGRDTFYGTCSTARLHTAAAYRGCRVDSRRCVG